MSGVALLFLHSAMPGWEALTIAGLAAAVTMVVRGIWSDLPRFVAGWLDLGVMWVAVLVGVAATGLVRSLGYLMLVGPRIVALLAMASLLGASLAALAYSHRRLAAEVAEQAARLAQSRHRAAESRLAALSAQINPHFLFNTLNTLAEVVHEDEDQAEDLITDLAGMMRYALDSSARRVPLSEEFAVIERLLRIESARLGERLVYRVELDPEVAGVQVPGLIVQPLIENAVRHGVANRPEGGRIELIARRVGESCRVEVRDDGPGLPETCIEGLGTPSLHDAHDGGLKNVAERVRLTWPDGSASLTVERGPPDTLVITFPLESP